MNVFSYDIEYHDGNKESDEKEENIRMLETKPSSGAEWRDVTKEPKLFNRPGSARRRPRAGLVGIEEEASASAADDEDSYSLTFDDGIECHVIHFMSNTHGTNSL